MNIHEAAIEVLHSDELPELSGNGLCYVLQKQMPERGDSAYSEMHALTTETEYGRNYYLGLAGEWTDQRLNIVVLLAITTPGDFV